MKLDARQVQAVVMLPAPQRYEYFVKRAVETGVVWSLFRQGWALAKKDDGTLVFPLWPDREFATICADYEWTGYEAQPFALDALVEELLPQLEQDGIATGVFYTPGARELMPSAGLLRRDLLDERRQQSKEE